MPQLSATYKGRGKDIAYRTFQKRKNCLKRQITFVACSRWLESLAKKVIWLKVRPITNIPNVINTNLFKPRDKNRPEKNATPQDKSCFSARKITDKRKEIDYLVSACKQISFLVSNFSKELGVVVLATSRTIRFPVSPHLSDELCQQRKELVDIYNAVDLYVTPSLQDNRPNTIVEAMACGIPHRVQCRGIPQMIDHPAQRL